MYCTVNVHLISDDDKLTKTSLDMDRIKRHTEKYKMIFILSYLSFGHVLGWFSLILLQISRSHFVS